jgi:hypothetical protein
MRTTQPSTAQQHHNENDPLSFESINAHIEDIYMEALTSPIREAWKPDMEVTPADEAEPVSRTERFVKSYRAVRPILVALGATPFIPGTWCSVVTTFVIMLDDVSASFKAGKDQLVSDIPPSVAMEPKLPVG